MSGGVGHAFAGVCGFGCFRRVGRFFGRGSVFGEIRAGGGLRGGVRYGNGRGRPFSGSGCLRTGLKGGRCRFAVPAFRGTSGCPESSIGSLSPGMRGSSVSAGIAGCQAVVFPAPAGIDLVESLKAGRLCFFPAPAGINPINMVRADDRRPFPRACRVSTLGVHDEGGLAVSPAGFHFVWVRRGGRRQVELALIPIGVVFGEGGGLGFLMLVGFADGWSDWDSWPELGTACCDGGAGAGWGRSCAAQVR